MSGFRPCCKTPSQVESVVAVTENFSPLIVNSRLIFLPCFKISSKQDTIVAVMTNLQVQNPSSSFGTKITVVESGTFNSHRCSVISFSAETIGGVNRRFEARWRSEGCPFTTTLCCSVWLIDSSMGRSAGGVVGTFKPITTPSSSGGGEAIGGNGKGIGTLVSRYVVTGPMGVV
jgi:hypothetical protein